MSARDANESVKDASIQAAGRLGIAKTYKIYIDGKFPRTESGRYFEYAFKTGTGSANLCWSSRKDFRDAVTSARGAFAGWAKATAFNRGQILYRIAEMLESRRSQFIEELTWQGLSTLEAEKEVATSIDRLVYFAGWADKYQQVYSAVNPVSASYFNFSILEPTGVVSILAPEESALLGLVSVIAPVIAGGNTCVVLVSGEKPLSAVTFAEVLNSSDLPGGVVNILTGQRKELLAHMSTHMDVNALVYTGSNAEEIKTVQLNVATNVKRLILLKDWNRENPNLIQDTQEVKTTWHPIGI